MVNEPSRTLRDLVEHVGRFPEDAFLFVREGLGHTADQIHGPETEAHRQLQQYLLQNELDWGDLVASFHAGELPDAVVDAIEEAGGCDKLDRHVNGRELCWGLRDFALQRWGMMARAVLETWNVHKTKDFGRIVFGFIDLDLMRKQFFVYLDDSTDIYTFPQAFDQSDTVIGRDAQSDSPES